MAKRLCAFCGQPNEITNEHVWAEWIGPLMGVGEPDTLGVVHSLSQLDNADAIRYRTQGLSHTVNVVCTACNSGWMSRLESRVKSLLSPMIRTGRSTELSDEDQTLIATWATKTAMVCEFLKPPSQPTYYTAEERLWLAMHDMPPNDVHVWLAQARAPHWCDGLTQHFGFPTADGRIALASVTTHAIGWFAFQVFSYRRAIAQTDYFRIRKGPWDDALHLIWPTENAVEEAPLVWPPPIVVSEHLWDTFCDRILGLAHPPRLLP